MKICFICPEYPEGPHGGIGTYTQTIARELAQLGHQIRVIGVYSKSYPAPNYEEDGLIRIWRIRQRSGKFGWILSWVKQYRVIKRWIKEKEIDIVEAPDSRGWYAFWGNLSIPIILRFHGSQTYISHILKKSPNWLTKSLEKLSYQRSDAFTSVSIFNANTTASLCSITKPIKIIYNGISSSPVVKSSKENFLIIFAGTLSEYKGIIDFLDAILLLSHEEIEFRVSIYGKDVRIGKKMASDLITNYSGFDSLKGRLKYFGWVPNTKLLKVYQNASVAVFPSHVESFGLAPIEAMMCECPVIFTNNTTGPELIDNYVDGILVEPKNPKEIKDTIYYLFKNPEKAIDIGKRGRSKVLEKFNIQKQVDELLSFYLSVIKEKKCKG